MDEERSRVLEMLTEGRLTPEQAEQLLEALEEPADQADDVALQSKPVPEVHTRPRKGPADWMTSLSTDQIIALKTHGVDAAFVQQARRLGLGNLSFEQIITLAIHGIDAAFVKQFRDMGMDDLSFDQVVALGVHGVSADYIKELREAGLELSFDQIIAFAIHGVDVDFIQEMRELGFGGSPERFVELKTEATPGDQVTWEDDA